MNNKITIVKSIPDIECFANEIVNHPDCTVEFLKEFVIELNELIKLNETNE